MSNDNINDRLRAAIARAREIEAAATPGRWEWGMMDGGGVLTVEAVGVDDPTILWARICPSCKSRGWRCTAPTDANATELVAARNQHAALLDVAEAASKSVVCVEWVAGEWGDPPVPCVRLSRAAFDGMRDALARLLEVMEARP